MGRDMNSITKLREKYLCELRRDQENIAMGLMKDEVS